MFNNFSNSFVPAGSSAAAVEELPAAGHGKSGARIGMWALAAGLVGFVAWACLAPLDEGVPAAGSVVVDTKRKPVQHLTGGIIRQVLVKEGDLVKQGQPLIELDQSVARANFETVRLRYLGLRAGEGRLVAEQNGWSAIRFHPDLLAAKDDPQIAAQMRAQEQLLSARKAALTADLQGIQESIQGNRGSIEAYRGMMESRRAQFNLLKDELSQTRGLVQEGYAPRNRQLELERMVADSLSAIADLQGNIVKTQHAVSEAAQRAAQRRSEYVQETARQLSEVLRDVQADGEKFRAAREELARMEIRSPANGHVVGLAQQSVDAVIQPAQKLMDIVPEGATLTLEARVPPQLIDRIQVDQPVDVRFSSFAHAPQLVVAAKVLTVSADLLTDPQNNTSYYLARVAVTPAGMKTLGARQLQPGMPCELIFKTGERTLLTYMLHPLTKRLAASMTEE